MKKAVRSAAALGLLMLLSGCRQAPGASFGTPEPGLETSEPGLETPAAGSKTEAIPFAGDQLYAVAWVGYDDLTELPSYLDRYVGGGHVPTHYFSDGEYYLVIPRYSDMDLKLYKNDIEAETPALVFEESECGPFLIQCNISDIFSDVTVSFTRGEDTAEFSPYISLKDGSVEVGERGLRLIK